MKKILCILLSAGMLTSTAVFADNASDAVYVMENNGAFSGKYENGKFDFSTMQASNGAFVSLKNIDGTNYVPFRYLLEEIGGFKDETGEPANSDRVLYDKIREIKTPAFIWEKIDDVIHLYITDGENYYTGKADEILKDKDDKDTGYSVKLIDGSYYIPLRALELFGLTVNYCSDSELIVLSKGTPADVYAVNTEYKKIFNNNYFSYSSYYDATKKQLQNAYCVNKYDEYLFYVDSEKFKIYTAIDGEFNSERELPVTDTSGNLVDLTTDMITFTGNKIFGISTANAGDYAGNLFSVEIKVDVDGNLVGENYREYDDTVNSRSIISTYEKKGNFEAKFLYTIDNGAGEQIKRINISDPSNPVEEYITELTTPVSDFSLNGTYMLYTDKSNLYIARIFNKAEAGLPFDRDNVKQKKVEGLPEGDIIVRNIISVNGDASSNELFYCIIEQAGASYIYVITTDGCKKFSDDNIFGAKNLTILDRKIYVNIDGTFREVK